MLPTQYRWLEAEPAPRMIIEALKEYGTLEAPGVADNPKIIGWQDELEAAGLGRAYAGVYRTYIIAAVLVLVVAVEKGLGIDVPGVDVGSDWLTHVLAALGLGTLRAGINGANK